MATDTNSHDALLKKPRMSASLELVPQKSGGIKFKIPPWSRNLTTTLFWASVTPEIKRANESFTIDVPVEAAKCHVVLVMTSASSEKPSNAPGLWKKINDTLWEVQISINELPALASTNGVLRIF